MAAALNERKLQPDSTVFCENGLWNFNGTALHDHRAFSYLSVRDILIKSSNIGAAKLALNVGEQKFYEYVRRFGFGERTGIELPGEINGLIRPPQSWSKISIMDAGRFDAKTAYAAVNTLRLDDLKPHIYRTHDGGKTWTHIVNGLPDGATINVVREDPKRRGLSRIARYVGFDTTRPKVDVPSTEERGLSWIAQHASFDTASPK